MTTSPMRSRASSSVATAAEGRRAGGGARRRREGAAALTVREAVDAEADLVRRLGLELSLEELRAEDEHVRLRVERLRRREEADALEGEALLAHDLDDVEGGPAHVVAEHVELSVEGGWEG